MPLRAAALPLQSYPKGRQDDRGKEDLRGGKADPNKDPLLTPTGLTEQEIGKIVAFLRALTSTEPVVKPTLP